MLYTGWLWRGTICLFCLTSLSFFGVKSRRYEKCTTADGRLGLCTVTRYCRESMLQNCEGDDSYCCPILQNIASNHSTTENPKVFIPEPPDRRQGIDNHDRFKTTSQPAYHDDNEPKNIFPDEPRRTSSGGSNQGNQPPGSPSYGKDDTPAKNPHFNNGSKDTTESRKTRINNPNPSSGRQPSHGYPKTGTSAIVTRPKGRDRRKEDDHRYPNPAAERNFPNRDSEPPRRSDNPVQNRPPVSKPRNPNLFLETYNPRPKVPACGVKPYELFIAGGEESTPHEWPWMTAIFRRPQDSRPRTFLCGGSLINTKYVLTAAHCFMNNNVKLPPSLFVVNFGSHYLYDGEEYSVSDLILHHNHSGSSYFNDIALVRLGKEVYITDKIAPICLPFPEMIHENMIDRMATVAGWGDVAFRKSGDRILQHVTIPIVSSEECSFAYSRVKGAAFLARGTDHILCAGLREGGKDACLGDSGGPLMLKSDEDRWVIIGIVSLGYKCAEPGYPGVYTRIAHYMSWIHSNTKRR